ncbi:hypothetical protein OQA88_9067 [Cercophora sp. LCS_1]
MSDNLLGPHSSETVIATPVKQEEVKQEDIDTFVVPAEFFSGDYDFPPNPPDSRSSETMIITQVKQEDAEALVVPAEFFSDDSDFPPSLPQGVKRPDPSVSEETPSKKFKYSSSQTVTDTSGTTWDDTNSPHELEQLDASRDESFAMRLEPVVEDIVESDVDWDEVISSLPPQPAPQDNNAHVSSLPSGGAPNHRAQARGPLLSLSQEQSPFARPPFPPPLRDKSPVGGLTKSSVLRTCFRLNDVIPQGQRCLKAHQDAVFELYARVLYSSREKIKRAQHFRFRDLYKNQMPYLPGTLAGWKTGSLKDTDSATFIGNGNSDNAKMCRCVCRLVQGKKGNPGWKLDILSIKEVGWDDVAMVKDVVCRAQ